MKNFLMLTMLALVLTACGQKASSASDSNAESTSTTEAEGNKAVAEEEIAAGDESDWSQAYKGTLDGKIQVTLDLKGHGDIIRGTITYKNPGKPIIVLGNLGEDGSMFLREFQPDGLVTGVLSGTTQNGKYVGFWYGNGKELKLDLSETSDRTSGAFWPYAVKSGVAGEYGYHYPDVETGDPEGVGGITVREKGGKLTFSIDCVTGPPGFRTASVEEMEGTLENDEIRFTIPETDNVWVIRFFDGFAIVQAVSGEDDPGFGMGATIEGEFLKLR